MRAALLACLLLLIAPGATADPIPSDAIQVIDGDTIMVRGYSRHVRLLGFDTPETGFEARCAAERTLAAKATQRLRQIVADGGLDLALPPCACWRRMGKFACNDGRYCGVLKAKGRDVSALMIGEGLARPDQCGKACRRREPWC